MDIHEDYGQIDSQLLLQLIGNEVMKRAENTTDENVRYNVSEAMEALPGLETGLNVNVRLNSVTGFDLPKESVVFDILDIRLLHGWVVDPSDEETAKVIGRTCYNQLIEKLVAASAGDTSAYQDIALSSPQTKDACLARQTHEAEVIEHFLDSNAQQLTWHGLAELHDVLREGELAVLFR
eukprot:CAMPEP_0118952700 /NCGR_PEP_ID=MMETSP1169-20130426/55304_1 /TAXON_ID=36882 /ORGANISM="Pyramimonas obovata, Strain CCMP722" /LENGTH=179 /DNA_ID=CAMNT_0006900013 /DNA_START=360 /DNA_END=896 /DNA_ORIENTATION=+